MNSSVKMYILSALLLIVLVCMVEARSGGRHGGRNGGRQHKKPAKPIICSVVNATTTPQTVVCNKSTECPTNTVCQINDYSTPSSGHRRKYHGHGIAKLITDSQLTVSTCQPVSCVEDSDCGQGYECGKHGRRDEKHCFPAQTCAQDSDCASGFECESSRRGNKYYCRPPFVTICECDLFEALEEWDLGN